MLEIKPEIKTILMTFFVVWVFSLFFLSLHFVRITILNFEWPLTMERLLATFGVWKWKEGGRGVGSVEKKVNRLYEFQHSNQIGFACSGKCTTNSYFEAILFGSFRFVYFVRSFLQFFSLFRISFVLSFILCLFVCFVHSFLSANAFAIHKSIYLSDCIYICWVMYLSCAWMHSQITLQLCEWQWKCHQAEAHVSALDNSKFNWKFNPNWCYNWALVNRYIGIHTHNRTLAPHGTRQFDTMLLFTPKIGGRLSN